MTRKSLLGAAAVATVLSAGMGTVALAQDYTTGTMGTTVRDTSGTAISGATVTIKSDARGFERSMVTDAAGRAKFPLLPLGRYSVNVSKAGYTLAEQNVDVNIGASNEYTFTMGSSAGGGDEIFVTGTSRAEYDFNATTTGLTVNVDDLFEKTPIARNATAVALLAPGTALGDSAFSAGGYSASGPLASISGSSVAENAYYVNGLNVSNIRTFVGGSTIPFQFYKEIEVKTGGYSAEFGRSTGGVINTVTRSGTNEFEFGMNFIYQPDGLTSDSPDTFRNLNHMDKTEEFEANIWAAGPIIEDKLFFFLLYNPRDYEYTDVTTSFEYVQTREDPFWGVKLDFNITDDHLLEFTRFVDDQTQSVATSSATDGVVGDFVGNRLYKNGGENTILKYTGVFTDWLTVSVLWGENIYGRTDASSANGGMGDPWARWNDPVDGLVATDEATYTQCCLTIGTDKRELVRLDVDLYANFAGEHHFRVGFDQEKQSADTNEFYSGGGRYQYYGAAPGLGEGRRYIRELNGAFETELTAWYIQDAWDVDFVEDLSINIGIRNETFDNMNVHGETFAKMEDQIATRIGFTWDPVHNGVDKIFGFYGRYHLGIAANSNMRLGGNERYTRERFSAGDYAYNADGSLTATCAATDFDLVNPDGIAYSSCAFQLSVYGPGTVFDPAELIDENIDPMYVDEYLMGYNHAFDNGWNVGITATYRNLGSTIEDVAIDHAVQVWASDNGYGDVSGTFSGFHQYVLTNPGTDMIVSTTDLPGTGGALIEMALSAADLAYPEASRTYKALDFTFEREWDGVWSLQGSYTLSDSTGNYEGTVKSDIGQDDAGLTQDFDKPGLTEGTYGHLPNHRRHKLKLWGSYAVNDMVLMGANFSVTSPREYSCMGHYGRGPSDQAYWYGAASFYCDGTFAPRASLMESDTIYNLDVSMQLTPSIPNMVGEFKFRVDIFNILDADGAREMWNNGEMSGIGDLDPNYGEVWRYQSPRSVRFTASWEF